MEQFDERTWFCPRSGDQVSLTYIDLVPDLPAPLDDLQLLRHRLALETADVGALIEAHVVMIDSVPTLYQLLKLPIPGQDSGQAFIAAFTVPKATCSAVLRIQCAEGETTGLRESAVIAKVGPEAFVRPHPYAPVLEGRLPWHAGDDAQWDVQFPDHPLTRARAWANKTIATARIDPQFAQLPPFTPDGPGPNEHTDFHAPVDRAALPPASSASASAQGDGEQPSGAHAMDVPSLEAPALDESRSRTAGARAASQEDGRAGRRRAKLDSASAWQLPPADSGTGKPSLSDTIAARASRARSGPVSRRVTAERVDQEEKSGRHSPADTPRPALGPAKRAAPSPDGYLIRPPNLPDDEDAYPLGSSDALSKTSSSTSGAHALPPSSSSSSSTSGRHDLEALTAAAADAASSPPATSRHGLRDEAPEPARRRPGGSSTSGQHALPDTSAPDSANPLGLPDTSRASGSTPGGNPLGLPDTSPASGSAPGASPLGLPDTSPASTAHRPRSPDSPTRQLGPGSGKPGMAGGFPSGAAADGAPGAFTGSAPHPAASRIVSPGGTPGQFSGSAPDGDRRPPSADAAGSRIVSPGGSNSGGFPRPNANPASGAFPAVSPNSTGADPGGFPTTVTNANPTGAYPADPSASARVFPPSPNGDPNAARALPPGLNGTPGDPRGLPGDAGGFPTTVTNANPGDPASAFPAVSPGSSAYPNPTAGGGFPADPNASASAFPAVSPGTSAHPNSAPRGFPADPSAFPAGAPGTNAHPNSAPRGFPANPNASVSPGTSAHPNSAPRGFPADPSAFPAASPGTSAHPNSAQRGFPADPNASARFPAPNAFPGSPNGAPGGFPPSGASGTFPTDPGNGGRGAHPDPNMSSGGFPAAANPNSPPRGIPARFPGGPPNGFPADPNASVSAFPPVSQNPGGYPADPNASARFPAPPNGYPADPTASSRFPAVPNGFPADPNASATAFPPVSQNPGGYPADPNASARFPAPPNGFPADPNAFPPVPSNGGFPTDPNASASAFPPVPPNSGGFQADPNAFPPVSQNPGGYPADPNASARFPAPPNGFPADPTASASAFPPVPQNRGLPSDPTASARFPAVAPNGSFPTDPNASASAFPPVAPNGGRPGPNPSGMAANSTDSTVVDSSGPFATIAPDAPAPSPPRPGAAPPSAAGGHPVAAPGAYPSAPAAPIGSPRGAGLPPGAPMPPVEGGDVMHTVLIGLPIGGYLPLWHNEVRQLLAHVRPRRGPRAARHRGRVADRDRQPAGSARPRCSARTGRRCS